MQLDQLPLRKKAWIQVIDWAQMSEDEGKRLESLGIEEGAQVEALHRGVLFWQDPIAVKVGRMTIAIRKAHASAISVSENNESQSQ